MPLIKSASDRAFKTNVKTLMGEVGKSPRIKSPQQALAVAFSEKRRAKRADGGDVTASADLSQPLEIANDNDRSIGLTVLKKQMTSPAGPAATKMDTLNAAKISAAVPRDSGPRQGYSVGGLPAAPWFIRRSAGQMAHIGAIQSPVAGRTDHLPLSVSSGSYVVPADIVSGLGQGNTEAGHQVLGKMFKSGPFGGPAASIPKGHAPKLGKMPTPPNLGFGSSSSSTKTTTFAAGGQPEGSGQLVPIMAAGGEHVISPEQVAALGGGDIKEGHEILDHFVKIMRQKLIKTLRKLPGPAKR